MTHELKKIIEVAIRNQENGQRSVLATVVALNGSSYRKPGVRMLIAENGKMTGAVSGGCVEKEVLLQAQSVFTENAAKIMTYDGRYRLGCEGVLYILLEPFSVSEELKKLFWQNFEERKPFNIRAIFRKEECHSAEMGSVVSFKDGTIVKFSEHFQPETTKQLPVFNQNMKPLFRIFIFGAEHDAVQLCAAAALLGWEVKVIASPQDPRTKTDFPGAEDVLHLNPQEAQSLEFDSETAVILINHNYAKDLQFLLAIKDKDPVYIALLGSRKRREKLFDAFIENHPEIDDHFLDKIHGPAGLDIGAITPQEIAVSILSEILTITRKKEPDPLRKKQGKIHN